MINTKKIFLATLVCALPFGLLVACVGTDSADAPPRETLLAGQSSPDNGTVSAAEPSQEARSGTSVVVYDGGHAVLGFEAPGSHRVEGVLLDADDQPLGGVTIRAVRFQPHNEKPGTPEALGSAPFQVVDETTLSTDEAGKFAVTMEGAAGYSFQLDWDSLGVEEVRWSIDAETASGESDENLSIGEPGSTPDGSSDSNSNTSS